MSNQRLTDYIKQQREAGKSEEEIKNSLLEVGRQEEEVDKVLGNSDEAPPPPPSELFSSTGSKQLDPRVTWIFFVRFMIPFLVILASYSLMMIALLDPGTVHNISTSTLVISFIVILLFGLSFSHIWSKLSYKYYLYELTEDDFRKECGVIFKKYETISYERIQNINIQRGILDRIFGLSSLKIFTAGTGVPGAAGAEGLLPGLSESVAEELRSELIRRSRYSKNQ